MDNNENQKIYITIEDKSKKTSGVSAVVFAALAVGCLMLAFELGVADIFIFIGLIVGSVVFASIGVVLCNRLRKYGGSFPYAKTFGTIGYIACLLIIIAAGLLVSCTAGCAALFTGFLGCTGA